MLVNACRQWWWGNTYYEGKNVLGCSSPANPALIVPDPLINTLASGSRGCGIKNTEVVKGGKYIIKNDRLIQENIVVIHGWKTGVEEMDGQEKKRKCVCVLTKQTNENFLKTKKNPHETYEQRQEQQQFFFFSSFLFNFHHLSFSRYKHQRLNNNNNEAILIYSNVAWFHRLSFYRRCASWRGKCFFLLQLPFIIVALLTSLPQLSNVIKGMDHQQQTLLLNWQVSNPGYSIIFLFFLNGRYWGPGGGESPDHQCCLQTCRDLQHQPIHSCRTRQWQDCKSSYLQITDLNTHWGKLNTNILFLLTDGDQPVQQSWRQVFRPRFAKAIWLWSRSKGKSTFFFGPVDSGPWMLYRPELINSPALGFLFLQKATNISFYSSDTDYDM